MVFSVVFSLRHQHLALVLAMSAANMLYNGMLLSLIVHFSFLRPETEELNVRV